ncbi:MAG: glycosyltransferase family 4 protein [Anaerolineae bacterium]|nr:glycosyltransferase family 4 protein [Anaerolineae bacterium]
MKVCMTHYAFYPTTGGVETHLMDLCAELVRQGHEVHALVGSMEGEPAESEVEGIQVHRRDWMNPEIMRDRKRAKGVQADHTLPEMQAEVKKEYADFIGQHNIELVHAHNFHHFLPEYGLALTEIRRERRIPTFLTIHEMWGEFLVQHLLENTEWDGIIAVGQHVYGDVVAQIPDLQNLHIVLHGVNTDMFRPDVDGSALKEQLGLAGKRVILHPARLLPWKGVHTTVEAFRMIAHRYPDVSVVITDTREILDWIHELQGYRDHIFSMVEDSGLSDRVVMRSFDFAKELPQAYAMSDIVVYPTSGEEPFGLVPLEAMSSGKPVIVSRSGGLVESVLDGVTGFVIPKEDDDMMADRLSALLAHPHLAERMGNTGRKHVLERFTLTRMIDEVEEIYRQGLERMRAQEAEAKAAS